MTCLIIFSPPASHQLIIFIDDAVKLELAGNGFNSFYIGWFDSDEY